MKVKRFSKLDTLQDSIKIVSKKTGESLTINRFRSFIRYSLENLLRDLKNEVIRDRHLIFT